jgi:sporulation-control protein spo0M
MEQIVFFNLLRPRRLPGHHNMQFRLAISLSVPVEVEHVDIAATTGAKVVVAVKYLLEQDLISLRTLR